MLRPCIISFVFVLSTFQIYSQRVIFYHLPKTAGCTTRYLLETMFDYDKVAQEMFYYELESKKPSDLEHYDLISGHFFFHSNLYYLDGFRVTFLRDPVQRILSEQRFYQKFYKDRQRQKLLSIQHYNPAGEPIETVSNLQVLYLSSLDRHDLSIPIEAHFESAKKNLHEAFDFIGLFEDYKRSVQSLFGALSWPQKEIIPVLQSADSELMVETSELLGIQERNRYDIMLYEEAKKLYYEKYRKELIEDKKPEQFYSELIIDFKNSPFYEGFSAPIFFMDVLYRPIAPSGKAFIKVPLESSNSYKMTIYTNKTIQNPNFIIMCRNQILTYESAKSRIECIIPQELIEQNGSTKIEFIVEGLDDTNLKWDRSEESTGIAFRKIEIDCF